MTVHQPEVAGTLERPMAATVTRTPVPERRTPAAPASRSRLLRLVEAIKHEFPKFGAVGFVAFTADTVVFLAFRVLLGEPMSAKIIAGVTGTSVAFIGNRYWTWRHRPRTGLGREYTLYAIISGIGLCIQLGFLAVSHYGAGQLWPGVFRSVMADMVAQGGVGMIFASAFRFWAYRRFVFRTPNRANRLRVGLRPGWRRPNGCVAVKRQPLRRIHSRERTPSQR